MQLGEPGTNTSASTPQPMDQLQPGDPVRVRESVVVFHHPQHRGEAFDLLGQEGAVHTVLNDWKGRVISPNLPVIVAFGKFRAHFRPSELERI
jgi:folate-binding Fe-S cluster repair protein YgfZ